MNGLNKNEDKKIEKMEQNKRELGCTCVHGTSDNPIFGGYAGCTIHDPRFNKFSRIHVELPQPREYEPDSIVKSIIQKFKDRAEQGEKSYGANLDRSDYKVEEWIEEHQSELHDAYLYSERLKQDYQKIKRLLDLSLKCMDYDHLKDYEIYECNELLEWYKNSPNGQTKID